MGSLFFRVIQVDCQNNRPEDRYGNRGVALPVLDEGYCWISKYNMVLLYISVHTPIISGGEGGDT